MLINAGRGKAGLQLIFLEAGESIVESGEEEKMVPLGPANFAVRRALIRPLVDGFRGGGVSDKKGITSS